VGDGVGGVRSAEMVSGGNDPHRGHGQVCEGGVRQGMVKVRLLCFRWLSPFLSLPAYEDGTECSQTPGNYPKESIQHIEHSESLKSRIQFNCL
jgi:hypothetical protein